MNDSNTVLFPEFIILLLPIRVTHVGLLFRVQKFQLRSRYSQPGHLITKFDGKLSFSYTNYKNEQVFEKLFGAMSREKKITVKVIFRQSSWFTEGEQFYPLFD